jgi:hypothetical protein
MKRAGDRFEDYTQAVRNLARDERFPAELVRSLERLPGFRNVLEYGALDLARVVEAWDEVPDVAHVTLPRSKRYRSSLPGVRIHATTRETAPEESPSARGPGSAHRCVPSPTRRRQGSPPST